MDRWRFILKAAGWIGLILTALMACPAGIAQVQFTNVAPELGLDDAGSCGALFWYDYDNDGDLDLLQPRRFYENTVIFRNDGSSFTRLTTLGLPRNWDAGGAIPMDFDHDGDMDLFFPCYHTNSLMLVNENGSFVDRTTELGLPEINGSRAQLWVDFDQDGWMDILFGHYTEGFKLFRNEDGTHFSDVTTATQVPPLSSFHSICEADVDLDGDEDIFFTSIDNGDRFYINQGGGVFVDRTAAAGLSGALGRGGCAWADVDRDKYPDLLTQGDAKHTIWHNNQDGTFTEMNVHGTDTDFSGVWPYSGIYAVADFDMNALYDFYVCRPGGCGANQARNQFFICDSLNGLDIWFHDVAPALGMDFTEDGVPTIADFNGDGALDLMITRQGQTNLLYRNDCSRSLTDLQVRITGPNGELDKWHSRVELYNHGTNELVAASELNTSNVARNGFNNYFVVNATGHYDLRILTPTGITMGPEDYPGLSDVVPSDINHLITVRLGQSTSTNPSKPAVASNFMLTGAFPNPFNAVTTLEFSLDVNGPVSLAIYDITGRLVTTLLEDHLAQGTHSLQWNAAGCASGIYLAQLKSGDRMTAQKLVLLK